MVVHNEVNAPTDSVVREVGKGQSFRNNPLASERAITVNLQRREHTLYLSFTPLEGLTNRVSHEIQIRC